MRFLTPTDNKRLNELIGFLCMTFGHADGLGTHFLLAPRLVVQCSCASPGGKPVPSNWIGPVGAYGADALFQIFGFAAFLLPVAMACLGLAVVSQPGDRVAVDHRQSAMCCCCCPCHPCCRCCTFPTCAALFLPAVCSGSVISSALLTGFNWGAYLVDFALLVDCDFHDHQLLLRRRACLGREGAARRGGKVWSDAASCLALARLAGLPRRRSHAAQIAGDAHFRPQTRESADGKVVGRSRGCAVDEPESTIHLQDETDIFSTTRPEEGQASRKMKRPRANTHKAPIFVMDQKPEKAARPRKAGDPKIAKGSHEL